MKTHSIITITYQKVALTLSCVQPTDIWIMFGGAGAGYQEISVFRCSSSWARDTICLCARAPCHEALLCKYTCAVYVPIITINNQAIIIIIHRLAPGEWPPPAETWALEESTKIRENFKIFREGLLLIENGTHFVTFSVKFREVSLTPLMITSLNNVWRRL